MSPPQQSFSNRKGSQDAISIPSAALTPITTTTTSTPNATSSSSTPFTATSVVRWNPVYGLVEAVMENYTHIDRSLAFPSARGPQAALDDQPPIINNPAVIPHSVNISNSQLQGPQSAITNVPIEKDVVRMSISASHGNKDAQVAFGDMYKDGKGVPQDYQPAIDWYLKAVDQGEATGQQRVGGLFDEWFGVSQNHLIAMDWYLRAAEQGHAESQSNIGDLYSFGRGVPQDYAQAMEWYNLVIGESDSCFVTLVELEKAQEDMAFLDKVKEKEKKLYIVCLNDGIIEERNGMEVRALLTEFLEDRYGRSCALGEVTVDK
ncbi:hypothetical protein BGX30_013080 [Mortierella sp. GBA39]|nr:hypothetical protein BGX30_013080 [Mortierella sp. GBA39]